MVAVIVYTADEETAVGVPLMAPVLPEKDKPAGRVGVIDHDVTVPPLTVGVFVVMAISLVRVIELGL